jgi:hypothetical protein
MERLLDVDAYLKAKIPDFVRKGDFGLASGADPSGAYQHLWFEEEVGADEITIDADVYLLTKARAKALKKASAVVVAAGAGTISAASAPVTPPTSPPPPEAPIGPGVEVGTTSLRLSGDVPFESWNRIGTRLLSKLKAAGTLSLTLDARVSLDGSQAAALRRELTAAVQELGLADRFRIE